MVYSAGLCANFYAAAVGNIKGGKILFLKGYPFFGKDLEGGFSVSASYAFKLFAAANVKENSQPVKVPKCRVTAVRSLYNVYRLVRHVHGFRKASRFAAVGTVQNAFAA